MAQAARKLRLVEDKGTSERLRGAFPEIDFDKIAKRGNYNQHNLREKWDALVRQVDWWIDSSR